MRVIKAIDEGGRAFFSRREKSAFSSERRKRDSDAMFVHGVASRAPSARTLSRQCTLLGASRMDEELGEGRGLGGFFLGFFLNCKYMSYMPCYFSDICSFRVE